MSAKLVTTQLPSPSPDLKNRETLSATSPRTSVPESATSSKRSAIKYDTENINPFRMPPDSDIFVIRDLQRQKKKEEHERQAKLHIHEKTTYATKMSQRSASKTKPMVDDDVLEEDDHAKDDPEFIVAISRDRHVEKESLADYINKKREMFLVQYSLGVKRDEMRKLEEIAQSEERKLELAEQYLEEDAALFDEFLKENDKNSVEAIKGAEAETKVRFEKVAEIKRIHTQMMSIKSDISKFEDMLKEYQLYKTFIDKLTPNEWKDAEDQEITRLKNEHEKKQRLSASRVKPPSVPQYNAQSPEVPGLTRQGSKRLKHRLSLTGVPKQQHVLERERTQPELLPTLEPEDAGDAELGLSQLYFSQPAQLLDIFAELEEQNLSLIQNSQETEEALEEMKQMFKLTQRKMNKETEILKAQIHSLVTQIEKEEHKAQALETKAKMFSYGEFKADVQEQLLEQLNTKVEDVYRSCIGDNEASISTLQMLTNIENRLEDLFETIEMMPADKVEIAEKAKEKERRLKLREEKLEQQRLHQEERVRRALERAKAEPKKYFGKRLVYRSEPPRLKKKLDKRKDQATREEEELAYYFQW